jgi:hypothetical protein
MVDEHAAVRDSLGPPSNSSSQSGGRAGPFSLGAVALQPGNDDEVRGSVFFLSYARARSEPRVHRLYHDLISHVDELTGLPPGPELGYLDRGIPPGSFWSRDLAAALSTYQVFVALVSPHFLRSPWCCREWHAFERRPYRETTRAPRPGVGTRSFTGAAAVRRPVLPVHWVPVQDELPERIGEVQFFGLPAEDGELVNDYREHGIYGLINRRDSSSYDWVVWRLAQEIVRTWYAFRVEQVTDLPDLEGLRTSWDEAL